MNAASGAVCAGCGGPLVNDMTGAGARCSECLLRDIERGPTPGRPAVRLILAFTAVLLLATASGVFCLSSRTAGILCTPSHQAMGHC